MIAATNRAVIDTSLFIGEAPVGCEKPPSRLWGGPAINGSDDISGLQGHLVEGVLVGALADLGDGAASQLVAVVAGDGVGHRVADRIGHGLRIVELRLGHTGTHLVADNGDGGEAAVGDLDMAVLPEFGEVQILAEHTDRLAGLDEDLVVVYFDEIAAFDAARFGILAIYDDVRVRPAGGEVFLA